MKQKAAQSSHSWLYYIIPPSILAAITALIYYPSLNYEFQFDDIANITKHFNIRSNTLASLKFTGTRWISYWLNSIYYSISKFNPYPYRVGNVLIHTANGLLVFFILFLALSRLKNENFFKKYAFGVSFLTSLLFLLHPVQTQTVSYVIQGELEGLATLSILSMVLCLFKMLTTQNSTYRNLFGGLLFSIAALSCGTKEIAIISPALLVIFDWFFIAQGDWKEFKKRIWLYAALAAFIVCMYLWLIKSAFFTKIFEYKKNNIGNVITADPNAMITPWSFFISQFKVLIHYLWIFIWPFNISVEYDWMMVRGFFALDCLLPLALLLGVAYAVYKELKKNVSSLAVFGLTWFFACMAPRSSFIPSPELLVDYKTYMASFGYLFLISSFLVYGFVKASKYYKNIAIFAHTMHGPALASLMLAIPIGFYTVQRNKIWRSGLEFWENIIHNAPGKARGYNNYAVELSQNLHQFKEAIPYFQKAIAMDPKYADPCNNLAVAYSHCGKIDEAIESLKQGLRINPTYPEGYNNLASFFILKKEYQQAEKMLEIALKLRPYYGKAFFNMGRIWLEKGDQEKAWLCFKNCCTKGDLDTDIGFGTYAKVSLALKKIDDAIYGYQKALELNPNFPEAKFNLGNAYHLAQQYDKSIVMYQQVVQESPNELRAWYNLGESHLKLGKFDKALECFYRSEKAKYELPQLPIRIAGCLEKLGRRPQAISKLHEVTTDAQAPTNMREIAKSLIAQMEKQPGKTKVA